MDGCGAGGPGTRAGPGRHRVRSLPQRRPLRDRRSADCRARNCCRRVPGRGRCRWAARHRQLPACGARLPPGSMTTVPNGPRTGGELRFRPSARRRCRPPGRGGPAGGRRPHGKARKRRPHRGRHGHRRARAPAGVRVRAGRHRWRRAFGGPSRLLVALVNCLAGAGAQGPSAQMVQTLTTAGGCATVGARGCTTRGQVTTRTLFVQFDPPCPFIHCVCRHCLLPACRRPSVGL